MEGGHFSGCNDSIYWSENAETDIIEPKLTSNLPLIPQPQTPKEPIEFLSRSWSISAAEISKAFAQKQKHFSLEKNPNIIPETIIAPQFVMNLANARKTGASVGKWFHPKETITKTVKKKDKARVENARTHSALSVAGLAAAVAAVAAAENAKSSGSKTAAAMASATELLASHCIELAESTGVDRNRVASVVRSAVNIKGPSDLSTLTAAAATALRGEVALRARLPKDAKKNAAIIPYEKGMTEAHMATAIQSKTRERDAQCVGDLLQDTNKGVLQWKHVSVYINKKFQVIIKLKSKNVGGAFSKKNKGVVYGVCDENSSWPFTKERENKESYFGVKTAKGLLEFKCPNKIHKQKWVEGIQNLLQSTGCIDDMEHTVKLMKH